MGLSAEQIQSLLEPKPKIGGRLHSYQPKTVPANGPLKWADTEMQCTNLGCGSPTYFKVEGVPRCNIHAILRLNELVIKVTELRRQDLNGRSSSRSSD